MAGLEEWLSPGNGYRNRLTARGSHNTDAHLPQARILVI